MWCASLIGQPKPGLVSVCWWLCACVAAFPGFYLFKEFKNNAFRLFVILCLIFRASHTHTHWARLKELCFGLVDLSGTQRSLCSRALLPASVASRMSQRKPRLRWVWCVSSYLFSCNVDWHHILISRLLFPVSMCIGVYSIAAIEW